MITFYHYTSVECFRSILQSEEFHLTNIHFMNDYMEGRWLLARASEMLEARAAACKDDARREFSRKASELLRARTFDHTYCGCFSSEKDDLSQWRAYADNGAGVAVGLDLDQIVQANRAKAPNCGLEHKRVEYDDAPQCKLAEESIRCAEDCLANGRIAHVADAVLTFHLTYRAACCKGSAYKGESEERLILTWRSDDPLDQYRDPVTDYDFFTKDFPSADKLQYRARRGELVPMAPIKAPHEAIREIVVGPCFGGDDAIRAVELFLVMRGVDIDNVKVSRSAATYRGIAGA